MMKKRVSFLAVSALLATSLSFTAFAEGKIYVDLEEVQSDTTVQTFNDATMVPVRAITEMLGYDVNWIPETEQVEVCEKGTDVSIIIMNIGQTRAYYGEYVDEIGDYVGHEVDLDVPAMLINDRTFVPLRFISEAVGYTVDYDVENDDVYLFSSAYTDALSADVILTEEDDILTISESQETTDEEVTEEAVYDDTQLTDDEL